MATPPAAADAPPASGGKKKLIIILAVVLVLVLGGGAAAVLLLKKKAPAEGEDGEEQAAAVHTPAAAPKPGTPPVFVPLEPFTVNLADRDVDRFAQVGVTLEVVDAKFGEQVKLYMPAIRSNILMVLSHKMAADLLSLEGKQKLAKEINREAVRPMGIELDDEEEEPPPDEAPKKKKKKKKPSVVSPVLNVHFSNFIVQ
ncbi:flagellar basal body-associated FliL family protein [Roseateles sp.]|jgi:flagellar FliL protein|uniref:flagellar basal body-associated FliL family protein n=1 Tax=Roseateles sp. TaxID=1971397 RepID=UPI0037CC8F77